MRRPGRCRQVKIVGRELHRLSLTAHELGRGQVKRVERSYGQENGYFSAHPGRHQLDEGAPAPTGRFRHAQRESLREWSRTQSLRAVGWR